VGCACAPWGASQCVAIASRGLSHGLNEVGDAPLGAELLVREVFLAHGSPQFTMLDIRPSLGCFLLAPAAVFVRWSEFEFGRDGPVHLSPSVSRSEPGSRRLSPRALGNGLGCLGVRWKIEPGHNIRRLVFDGLFRPYKKIGRQHPALRASSFFPRLLRPHTLHSTHDHGRVHVDGAPHLPQHLLDRLPSRGASKGDPGSRTKALRRGASRVEILIVVIIVEVEGGERRRRRWILRELGQVPRRPRGSHPRSQSCSGRLGTANRTCGRPSPRGANPGQSY
jgi:hypothetical protein